MNVVKPHNVAIGHRADPHRHEKRTRLRVKVRPRSLVLGGCKLKQGEQVIEVPEGVAIEAAGLVEDQDFIRMAETALSNKRAAHQKTSPDEFFQGSLGSSFRDLHGREMLPLDECEEVETGLPPEMTAEDRRVAAVVSNITAQVSSGSNNSRGKRGNQ